MKELTKDLSLMWRESHKVYDLGRFDIDVRNTNTNSVGFFIEDPVHRNILNRIMFIVDQHLGDSEVNQLTIDPTYKQLEDAWFKIDDLNHSYIHFTLEFDKSWDIQLKKYPQIRNMIGQIGVYDDICITIIISKLWTPNAINNISKNDLEIAWNKL